MLRMPSFAQHPVPGATRRLARLGFCTLRRVFAPCTVRGKLVLVSLVLLGLHLLPLVSTSTPPVSQAPASTPAVAATFCGTPAAVFAQFDLAPQLVPDATALASLPGPGAATDQAALTYDPARGVLCAADASALTSRFVPVRSAGAGPAVVAAPQAPHDLIDDAARAALNAASLIEQGFVQTVDDFFAAQIAAVNSLGITHPPLCQGDLLGLVLGTPCSLSYNNQVILNLNAWMVLVMDAFVVLALVLAGYFHMLGYYRRGGWVEYAPKIVFCTILATFALPLLSRFIDLENVFQQDFQLVLGTVWIWPPTVPPGNIIGVIGITYMLELIAILLLSVMMIVRLALLNLLLVLAPLAILCYALPASRPWGRLWAQAFVSTLIVQPLQWVAVGIGSALAAGLLAGGAGSLVGVFVALASIYLAFKLPGMLLSNALRAMSTAAADAGSVAETAANVAAYLIA